MKLDEQLAEYKEIKDLLKSALTNNLSSGSIIGYTTNSTKIVYEGATKTNELIKEYNRLIATAEHQISSLKFRGLA